MDNNQIRELIKNLRITMRCPKCGKKYNLEEIFLKGYVGSTYFLQLNCSSCQIPVYATIAVSGNLAEKAEKKVTDQKIKAEVQKPVRIKKTKITTDDIIEMHQFLDKYRGDFSELS